ncbi:MAG: MFS transporter [Candidatus Omnitrophica bacterium]|nr:MFS transporter [Candidatus Omnitrophota bacterium]
MLDIITRFVQPIVRIKREEWRKAILMFFYFAFTIATLYILKPVRSSLFLTTHGAENLRYAYVGEGLFLILITFAYIKLSHRFTHKNLFFSLTTGFFVSNIFIFWALFKSGYLEWLSYIFYFWVAAYSITIVTQCWTLANDIFNPQEAKRLFGFIVSGGSLGGIFGGLAAHHYAERIGTENLLLLGGFLLCACIVLINMIWKYERVHEHVEERSDKETAAESFQEKSTWKLFLNSRYLLLIAALVMIAKISSTIIDNQFNAVVESSILEKNARTAFFGGFLALLNGVSFFMQLVLASYALRHLGIGISLLMLPIGLCMGSAATIFLPLLSVAALTKIYDGSLNYSINQLGKEILYLPIPSRTRYRVKPLIDMLVYRASKSVAGLLIMVVTPLLGIPDQKLGAIVLLLSPLWILAVWGVRDEYMQSIKKLLSDPRGAGKTLRVNVQSITGAFIHLEGERSFEKLKELLVHGSPTTRKISAAGCLAFYSSAQDASRVRKLVEEMIRYEALELEGINVKHFFKENGSSSGSVFDRYLNSLLKSKQSSDVNLKALLNEKEKEVLLNISECLNDPHESAAIKRKAISVLSTLATQGAVDILLNSLASVDNRPLRFELIRALNRIRAKGERYEFSPWIIKKEVMSEIKSYKSILTAIEEYQRRKGILRSDEDYLLATLQAIREENLERIFRLLGLLYSSDSVHVIYDRLVEADLDKHVKANALELLQNVLEPEISWTLSPVLDEVHWAEMQKKDLEEIIREFLESRDRWLTVCAVFLIVELQLHHFHPQLKEAAHSQIPIIREAAEIALLKIGPKR